MGKQEIDPFQNVLYPDWGIACKTQGIVEAMCLADTSQIVFPLELDLWSVVVWNKSYLGVTQYYNHFVVSLIIVLKHFIHVTVQVSNFLSHFKVIKNIIVEYYV